MFPFAAANVGRAGGDVFIAPGQQAYTSAGTFSWTCPAGVTEVSVVCVGAGGGGSDATGGGGGGLRWRNKIATVPGQTYPVVVGSPGPYNGVGGDSTFNGTALVAQGGRSNPGASGMAGGTTVGGDVGGGNGGNGRGQPEVQVGGGGGAGGYSGDGGNGSGSGAATSGSGGGGGGGSSTGAGGGVGLFGEGASGAASNPGQPGSGGSGVTHGGGASGQNSNGGVGAVRIIWGTGRAFPSTMTGNL